jgi:hypothetical protein
MRCSMTMTQCERCGVALCTPQASVTPSATVCQQRNAEVVWSRAIDDDLAAAADDDGEDDNLATGREGFQVRMSC